MTQVTFNELYSMNEISAYAFEWGLDKFKNAKDVVKFISNRASEYMLEFIKDVLHKNSKLKLIKEPKIELEVRYDENEGFFEIDTELIKNYTIAPTGIGDEDELLAYLLKNNYLKEVS